MLAGVGLEGTLKMELEPQIMDVMLWIVCYGYHLEKTRGQGNKSHGLKMQLRVVKK